MPSTSTSSPPLLVLVTLASTIRPFAEVLPARLDGGALERQEEDPLGGVEAVDADLDRVAGLGQVPGELVGRDDALQLLAPRSTKTLRPRTAITLPIWRPLAGLGPALALRGLAAGALVAREAAGGADLEGRGVEPGHRGFELGVEVVVPLLLERDIGRSVRGLARGHGVEGSVNRGIPRRGAEVSVFGHRPIILVRGRPQRSTGVNPGAGRLRCE